MQDIQLQEAIDADGRSISKRFRAVQRHFPKLESRICALAEVMIAWRNRSVHSLSDRQVRDGAWDELERNKVWLEGEFRGMDFARLKSDFNEGGPPKFKEMASFIRATHELVRQLDELQLQTLEPKPFLRWFIWRLLDRPRPGETLEQARLRLAQSIWGKDESERLGKVISLLRNNGFSAESSTAFAVEFSDELLATVAAYKPKEILQYASPA